MILSYFTHYFIFFNVNEDLAVQVVKFTRGGSCVDNLRFFRLHRITYLSILSRKSLILLIAWNSPCYLHFVFCLFLWLIKLKCTPHSPLELFWGLYVMLRDWKRGTWSPELLGRPKLEWRPDLKGETSDLYHAWSK